MEEVKDKEKRINIDQEYIEKVYKYIKNDMPVDEFKEKPDAKTAAKYFKSKD